VCLQKIEYFWRILLILNDIPVILVSRMWRIVILAEPLENPDNS